MTQAWLVWESLSSREKALRGVFPSEEAAEAAIEEIIDEAADPEWIAGLLSIQEVEAEVVLPSPVSWPAPPG